MVRMVPSAVCSAPPRPSEDDDDDFFFDQGAGQVFSTSFHPDMSMVAAAFGDGTVRVYDPLRTEPGPEEGAPALAPRLHTVDPMTGGLPTMALRFRPEKAKSRNVLVSAGVNGCCQHWHLASGKCLHAITEDASHPLSRQKYTNQIFALEYSRDGTHFATAGKDKIVRIYEEATKSQVATLSQNIMGTSIGHSNCIFSVKFHPLEEHTVLSAGWDNTVCVWDLRADSSAGAVRSIYGPHVCGDALDIEPEGGQEVLTGAWRPDDQLQVWDFGSGRLIDTIEWPEPDEKSRHRCQVYAAKYSPDGRRIAAGGSGQNELRVFDAKTGRCEGAATALETALMSLDWAPTCTMLAAGMGDGSVSLYRVGPR